MDWMRLLDVANHVLNYWSEPNLSTRDISADLLIILHSDFVDFYQRNLKTVSNYLIEF